MGGSVSSPSFEPQAAAIDAQGALTSGILELQQAGLSGNLNNRAQMLLAASQLMPQQYTPDIWGQAGAYNTAKDTAYLNAVNSQALQEAVDPLGAKIRQNTEQMTANLTDPETLKKLSQQQFAQEILPSMYGTGLSNQSTIYGSSLFDKNTLAGIQLQQNLAQLGQPYQNLPQTGLNPTATAQAPMQAGAQAAAQGNSFLQGILGQTGSLQQSLESGQNALTSAASQGYGNLLSNIGQDIQAQQRNELTAGMANQAAQTQLIGAGISAVGSLGKGFLSGGLA